MRKITFVLIITLSNKLLRTIEIPKTYSDLYYSFIAPASTYLVLKELYNLYKTTPHYFFQKSNKIKNIYFKDIPGQRKIKKILQKEIQKAIKNFYNPNKKEIDKHAQMIVLSGPSGIGKTTLMQATANESKLAIFTLDEIDFLSEGEGNSEKIFAKFLDNAIKKKPSILLIDNIDCILEHKNIADILFKKIDGIEDTSGLIVLASTSYPDLSVPKQTKVIEIDPPNKAERVKIILYFLKESSFFGKISDQEKVIDEIAAKTEGFTSYEIREFVDLILKEVEDKKLDNQENISFKKIRNIIYNVYENETMGEKEIPDFKSKTMLSDTALHESAHTLMYYIAYELDQCPYDLDYVSLEPREGHLGITCGKKKKFEHLDDRNSLLNLIKIMLAGRISQELFGHKKEKDIGAASDLEQARNIAFEMVTKYGMGNKTVAKLPASCLINIDTKDILDQVNNIIDQEYSKTTKILTRYKALLIEIKKELLSKKRLYFEDIQEIVEAYKKENKIEKLTFE